MGATRVGMLPPMTDQDFASAFASLDEADEAVQQLHEKCCQPLRSPRMEALSETLGAARRRLDDLDTGAATATDVIDAIESAGSQIGELQVTCCAPARNVLYSSTLENLADVQRLLKRSFSLEH